MHAFLVVGFICRNAGAFAICGPRRVRLGKGIEYILPNGFPGSAVLLGWPVRVTQEVYGHHGSRGFSVLSLSGVSWMSAPTSSVTRWSTLSESGTGAGSEPFLRRVDHW